GRLPRCWACAATGMSAIAAIAMTSLRFIGSTPGLVERRSGRPAILLPPAMIRHRDRPFRTRAIRQDDGFGRLFPRRKPGTRHDSSRRDPREVPDAQGDFAR